MIDRTNSRIEEQEKAVRRANRRRYAFYRSLKATDRVLWALEEMNRDGVKTIPPKLRAELRELGGRMPREVREALRDTSGVQEALDGLFEAQERLFRWRYPDWQDFDPQPETFDLVS
ncbi:MAG TPA: hypothetical protein VKT31_09250 [Solirubrobacteraceae bacterium]|nr:hypothetical protein [Solirubrobacteraceae bacterium]